MSFEMARAPAAESFLVRPTSAVSEAISIPLVNQAIRGQRTVEYLWCLHPFGALESALLDLQRFSSVHIALCSVTCHLLAAIAGLNVAVVNVDRTINVQKAKRKGGTGPLRTGRRLYAMRLTLREITIEGR